VHDEFFRHENFHDHHPLASFPAGQLKGSAREMRTSNIEHRTEEEEGGD
jgi:hypothetical protein